VFKRLLFVLFSFGHCVVCPSLIYGFWLPPFNIFKLFFWLPVDSLLYYGISR
jgi:hypothetical protein